jgi:tetratricopeptide (TPR) repeat protein
MDNMGSGPLKARLLALVEQGLVEQQEFIAHLSDAERAAIGKPDAWSAKDHIAHNTAWKADATMEFATTVHGEVHTVESITVFNPRVFAEQQYRPWDAVLADMEEADSALRAAIEACSEADLSDPARFPWRGGFPLWTTALVSAYEHPAEHYAQFYLDSGDVARASTARQQVIDNARRLIGEKGEFGYIVYNLGCFYAQTGQRGLALAALREAFAGAPGLREGAPNDPELAPLHGDPAFQALVAESMHAHEGSSASID